MTDEVLVSIPTINILLDGQSVPRAENDLEEAVIDATDNMPAMATIRFHDPDARWVSDSRFKPGAKLKMSLAPSKSMQKLDSSVVFEGEIVANEPSFSALGMSTFTVRAYDLSHRLQIGTRSATFTNVTFSDIVRKVVGPYGLSARKLPKSSERHKYIIQNNQSDYDFLMDVARRSGSVMRVEGQQLDFAAPKDLSTTGVKLTMGENLRQFSVRASGAMLSKETKVLGWDYKAKRAITGKAIPSRDKWVDAGNNYDPAKWGKAFGSSITTHTTLSPETKTEADNLSKAAIADQYAQFIEADGVAYGNPNLLPGSIVAIANTGDGETVGQFDGTYYVTSATHIYNPSGYEVHFKVSGRLPQTFNTLLDSGSASVDTSGLIHHVVIGVVTNNSDPDNLARVKVKYPWLDGGETIESNWARVVSPFAGNGYGFYYMPNLNTEVLVAFEQGNPNRPYIIGSLWNGVDTLIESQNTAIVGGKTVHHIIRTPKGHKVVLDDSNGKESILIEDKTGTQRIFIDSSRGDITIQGNGNLLIDMKGSITIKAGRDINVEGMKGTWDLKSDFTVDAKGMVSLKAVSNATLESSTGQGKVAGSTSELSAMGITTVKGSVVRIN